MHNGEREREMASLSSAYNMCPPPQLSRPILERKDAEDGRTEEGREGRTPVSRTSPSPLTLARCQTPVSNGNGDIHQRRETSRSSDQISKGQSCLGCLENMLVLQVTQDLPSFPRSCSSLSTVYVGPAIIRLLFLPPSYFVGRGKGQELTVRMWEVNEMGERGRERA